MEFHLFQSTTTTTWLKHSQGSLDFSASLMTSLFMTVTPNNTQPMLCSFYDVQTNTLRSTLINANSARPRSPLQGSGCPRKVTKLIIQSLMPYPSSQNLPTGQNCVLSLVWSISFHPALVMNDFMWSGDHHHAFKAAKDSLTVAHILSY